MSAGADAEQRAEHYLQSQGLVSIERNYRCRRGELDLIMGQGETLVFVEVRLRTHAGFGSGAESVTAAKQKKLRIAAEHYLQAHPQRRLQPARFDVVWFDQINGEPHWLKNAF